MAVRRSRKTRKPPAPAATRAGRSRGSPTLIVILLAFLVVLAYLGYAGLFTRVEVTETPAGPFALMLKAQQGSYSQTPATIATVKEAAKSVGIESETSCGVFMDNPREVKTEKLRAQVGLVITPADREKVRKLPVDITYKAVPKANCLVAEFPFRTALSAKLGAMRVYPALMNAAKERNLRPVPVVEIYQKGESIAYIMPVVRAD